MQITIINGPNLNLLGKREPEIYGTIDFDTFFRELQATYPAVTFRYHQSNVEGELINFIQEAGFSADGIILNAGGYTHTSVAIADAVAAVKAPVVEVHLSNIMAREKERQTSLLSKNCKGLISGFGMKSYELAVIWLTVMARI
jgi:3-dehydroquinate dehydratase-2